MGWPEMVDGAGEAGAEESPAEEAETAGGAGEASAPEVAGAMAGGSSPTALGWGLGCWFGVEEGEVVLVGLAEAGWVRLEVEDSDMGANGVDDGACWVEEEADEPTPANLSGKSWSWVGTQVAGSMKFGVGGRVLRTYTYVFLFWCSGRRGWVGWALHCHLTQKGYWITLLH
jgi:hypothetical protein